MKNFWHRYFDYSRGERLGLLLLLAALIFLVGVRICFKYDMANQAKDYYTLLKRAKQMALEKERPSSEKIMGVLSPFDPNEVPDSYLYTILPGNVAHNLIRYRECGGRFYSKEDVRKIYGMTDEVFERLSPYLVIPSKPWINLNKKSPKKDSLFCFDPNTLPVSGWVKLGLSEKQASVIEHYREKGGKFKSVDDLRKMFVISPLLADRLVHYAEITSIPVNRSIRVIRKEQSVFEVNTADTSCLQEVNGMSGSLARRIIHYRDKLGGFYDKKQLLEVWGVTPEKFLKLENQISVNRLLVKKIDLNFASVEELARHPYIDWEVAKKIVRFRSHHGKIEKSRDLLINKILNQELYAKLEPYLVK